MRLMSGCEQYQYANRQPTALLPNTRASPNTACLIGCQRFIYNAKVGEDRNLKPAASIPMSINTGRWHVSFNDGDGDGDDVPEPSMQETTEYRIPDAVHRVRAA